MSFATAVTIAIFTVANASNHCENCCVAETPIRSTDQAICAADYVLQSLSCNYEEWKVSATQEGLFWLVTLDESGSCPAVGVLIESASGRLVVSRLAD